MKKIISVLILAMACIACGNQGGSSKLTASGPKVKESTISKIERESLIAAQKEKQNTSFTKMVNTDGLKLNINPPTPDGNITEAMAEDIGFQLLTILSENGIGGVCNVPSFAFGVQLNETSRKVTGSSPQKMIVQYSALFTVSNTISSDVYSSCTTSLTGVGGTFGEAESCAVSEIKNSAAITAMLKEGCDNILKWYNDNLDELKLQVEGAEASKDYAYALALVEAVPKQSPEAYEYAASKRTQLRAQLLSQNAAKELTLMKDAIAKAGDDYSFDVAVHFQLIPTSVPEYAEASELWDRYQERLDDVAAQLKAKAEADEAAARKVAEMEAARLHETELAKIEADKEVAKYEAKATAASACYSANRGFFRKLGDKIIEGMETHQ